MSIIIQTERLCFIIKRNDFILIGIILLIGFGSLIYFQSTKQSGNKVIVTVDGEFYKEYSLNMDGTYEIKGAFNGTNILEIHDGKAKMIDASCPDQLCVYQKAAEYNGESIVCLPNIVIVEVQSDNESGIDSIAN